MSDFFPEGKKITIAGEEFAIKPFVLKNRMRVLRIVADALIELKKQNPVLKPEDTQNPEVISRFIQVAGDRLPEIYEIVLERSREWLDEKVTLNNEIEILSAISEVNDLPFLFQQIGQLFKGLRKTD